MDDAKKKAGVPHSLSRKEEKANKRNTNKKRRQMDKKQLSEKAVSKAQQRFMGMVAAGKIKAPKGLSKDEARKFAKTKHKGLPEKVTEAKITFTQFLIESAKLNQNNKP